MNSIILSIGGFLAMMILTDGKYLLVSVEEPNSSSLASRKIEKGTCNNELPQFVSGEGLDVEAEWTSGTEKKIITCSMTSQTNPLRGNFMAYELIEKEEAVNEDDRKKLRVLKAVDNNCIPMVPRCQCKKLFTSLLQNQKTKTTEKIGKYVSKILVEANNDDIMSWDQYCNCFLKASLEFQFKHVKMENMMRPKEVCQATFSFSELKPREICEKYAGLKCGNEAITIFKVLP